MLAKDVFEHLRVTTMEIASPMLELLRIRGDFIKSCKVFIENSPDGLEKYEMLQTYNAFVKQDEDLVEIVQGRIDAIPKSDKSPKK
jgi:hypothetical protein